MPPPPINKHGDARETVDEHITPWYEEPTHNLLYVHISTSSPPPPPPPSTSSSLSNSSSQLLPSPTRGTTAFRIFRAGLGPHSQTLMHSHHNPTFIITLTDAIAYSETLKEIDTSESTCLKNDNIFVQVDGDNDWYMNNNKDKGMYCNENKVRKMKMMKQDVRLICGQVIGYENVIHRVSSFESCLDFIGVEVFDLDEKGRRRKRGVNERFRWKEFKLEIGDSLDWVVAVVDDEIGGCKTTDDDVAGMVVVGVNDGVVRIGDGGVVVRFDRGTWIVLEEMLKEKMKGGKLKIRNVGAKSWWGYGICVLK